MEQPGNPDVVLLATDWQPRALIRAQLIEEGLEVIATDTWSMMRRHLRPGVKPRLALVDLKGLANPEQVLGDLRVLMKPDRVLVLTATGTVPSAVIKGLGFRAVSRPIAIEGVVRAAVTAIRFESHQAELNGSAAEASSPKLLNRRAKRS